MKDRPTARRPRQRDGPRPRIPTARASSAVRRGATETRSTSRPGGCSCRRRTSPCPAPCLWCSGVPSTPRYRAGGWFGPTWSSTVDQRLEIDSEGVVFACDEGSLLAYPHPAPGVPVLPTHGRRWPLDRDGRRLHGHRSRHRPGLALRRPHRRTGAPGSDRRPQRPLDHFRARRVRRPDVDRPPRRLPPEDHHRRGQDHRAAPRGRGPGRLGPGDPAVRLHGRPPDRGHQLLGPACAFRLRRPGRITSWTDTNGSHYDYVYDDLDRCVYQSGTNGHVESRVHLGRHRPGHRPADDLDDRRSGPHQALRDQRASAGRRRDRRERAVIPLRVRPPQPAPVRRRPARPCHHVRPTTRTADRYP